MFNKKGWLRSWFNDPELHRLFPDFGEMLEYARVHHYNSENVKRMKYRKMREMEA